MNVKNLIPFNQRTENEARELGKKGGLNSGKIRKEKSMLKEKLQLAIDMLTKNALKTMDNAEEKELLKSVGIECFTLFKILLAEGTKPELKAQIIEMLWNRLEGKPRQVEDENNNAKKLFTPLIININPVKGSSESLSVINPQQISIDHKD